MFYGSFEHSIDSKGRLSIPSKFRDMMLASNENTFFLTVDFVDSCIVAYPFSRWKEVIDAKARSSSATDVNVKMFLRRLNYMGSECTIDKQGRILIPASLREEVGLGRDAVLIGMSDRIEIWNKESMMDAVPTDKEKLAEISRNLSISGN